MALSEDERHILLFMLRTEMVPDAAPLLTVREAIDMLFEIFSAGNAQMQIGEHLADEEDENEEASAPNLICIQDMNIDNKGRATILFQHGDKNGADPAVVGIKTRKIRKAGKTADEAVAHAAHLIVDTDSDGGTEQCRCALERVPNLGRSTVITFMNRLLLAHCRENEIDFVDKDSKKRKRMHPKLLAENQLSHAIKEDLKEGILRNIEFITHKKTGGFDEPDVVIPQTHRVTCKVLHAPKGKALWDLLERAKAWGKKHNFEQMQIRFKKNGTDQHLSPRFATDTDDAKDVLYSRFEVLRKFSAPLEQCHEKIVDDLCVRMAELVDNEALWK